MSEEVFQKRSRAKTEKEIAGMDGPDARNLNTLNCSQDKPKSLPIIINFF